MRQLVTRRRAAQPRSDGEYVKKPGLGGSRDGIWCVSESASDSGEGVRHVRAWADPIRFTHAPARHFGSRRSVSSRSSRLGQSWAARHAQGLNSDSDVDWHPATFIALFFDYTDYVPLVGSAIHLALIHLLTALMVGSPALMVGSDKSHTVRSSLT